MAKSKEPARDSSSRTSDGPTHATPAQAAQAAMRLTLALEAANLGDWQWDAATDLMHMSARAAEIYGVSPDGRFTRTQMRDELLLPDDQARAREGLAQVSPAHPTYDLEYRVRRANDGKVVWVAAKGRAQFDESGRMTHMLGVVQDITDRKEAEAALRRSEARFRFLAELGEATRDVGDPSAVMAIVARQLGTHLGVSRCAYAEVESDEEQFTIRHDYTDACPSTVGEYRLSLFGPRAAADQRGGRTLVIRDVDRELPAEGEGSGMFNAIGIKAIICCPLIRRGRLAAMMAVHQLTPRQWTADDVALVEAVVERCWAYIERARTARALEQRESEFSQLADAMPQIVFAATPDGHVDYFNRKWYEYTGLPEGHAGFDSWRHVHTREGLELAIRKWNEAIRSGENYEIEYRLRRHDGAYRWHLGRALPVRDERGTIVRWFGTNTDIHDHKLAEEAARREREQTDLVVKGANVGVWYCPLPFDRLIWDEKVKEHFHLPPDAEVTIDVFYERIHPDDRERTRASIDASITNRTPYDIDYRTVSVDGKHVKWIRATGRGFYDAKGDPTRFDGITIDVTDRTLTSLALRESEERYRLATRAANNAIWDWNLDTQSVRWNEAITTLFGHDLADVALTAGWWIEHIHPDDRERVAASIHRVIDDRASEQWEDEYRFRRANGTYAEIHDRGFVLRDPQTGRGLRMIGAMQDLTERIRNERERERLLDSERAARTEAEHASRMKDEFLATLSHELRTPLNAILGWSTLIRSGFSSPEDVKQGAETIERNARAQAQIIDDLLDMSRIISGKVRLEVAPIDMTEVVRAAIETVRAAADAKGIHVHTSFDPDLERVPADANRLQQVFWNLLSNAIKFTPRDGLVQVRVTRRKRHLQVSVTDTGEGIRPEFIPFVFDRFRQADSSTTRRHGGLGLGLAIVKQLVESHGGSVSVTSGGVGAGATFVVALPVQGGRETRDLTGAANDASATPGAGGRTTAERIEEDCGTLSGVSVLVVDDESDARELVRRLLLDCGAVVKTAASAEQAYARLREDRPRVLVSDIGMPGEDGFSLIRRVRSLPAEQGGRTPALALTAYAREDDRRIAFEAGFQLHAAKPVEPGELIRLVAQLATDADAAPR